MMVFLLTALPAQSNALLAQPAHRIVSHASLLERIPMLALASLANSMMESMQLVHHAIINARPAKRVLTIASLVLQLGLEHLDASACRANLMMGSIQHAHHAPTSAPHARDHQTIARRALRIGYQAHPAIALMAPSMMALLQFALPAHSNAKHAQDQRIIA
jgi:hypothetical protein